MFYDLYLNTGINFSIIYDTVDREDMINGILLEFELIGWCVLLSTIIGLVGAALQKTRCKFAIDLYVEFFRNTPLIIQLFFFYFAVSPLLPMTLDEFGTMVPLIGGFTWAVIALSLNAGVYNIETFRSGIDSVSKELIDTGKSLGMKPWLIFYKITFPLAFRVSLPALTNNMMLLIRGTTLAYVIAVPEILYVSNQIWTQQSNVPEMMVFLLTFYILLTSGFAYLMRKLEKKLSYV